MNPSLPPSPWKPLLLCAALGLAACGSLKSDPDPPPPKEELPPPQLTVTVRTEGPELCREGTWTLIATIEGLTPERVVLEGGWANIPDLTPPYRFTVDCATQTEGRYTFVVHAYAKGQGAAGPRVSLVVDRTPPRVESWRPNQPYPTTDTPVEIIFSEPLQPASLQAAPTRLRDGRGFSVPHQTVLSEDGKVLRLVPTSALGAPTELHAELIQRDMTDLAGNRLDADPSPPAYIRATINYWPFVRHTPSMSERNITELSFVLSRFSISSPPVVAFIERVTLDEKELAVTRWTGQAWERLPAPREPEARAGLPSSPQVAQDRDGVLVLAWLEAERLGAPWNWLHVMRYRDGAWTRLGAPMDTRSRFPTFQMALDAEGHPVIVYEENEQDVRVVRWGGQVWDSLGEALSGNPESGSVARHPAIAVGSSRVLVAWSEVPQGHTHSHVFVSEYWNQTWRMRGRPLRGSENGGTEKVSVALTGSATDTFVVWNESAPAAFDGLMFAANWKTFDLNPDWTTPEVLQGLSGPQTLKRPLLVTDSRGEPWVAWGRSAESGSYASYYRRRRSTDWEPEQLIAGTLLHGFQLDADGFPWAAVGYPREEAIVRPQ
jgi:hypothetical protein